MPCTLSGGEREIDIHREEACPLAPGRTVLTEVGDAVKHSGPPQQLLQGGQIPQPARVRVLHSGRDTSEPAISEEENRKLCQFVCFAHFPRSESERLGSPRR